MANHEVVKLSSGSTGPVIRRNQLWLLEALEDNLGSENVSIMRTSPIGHLLDIPFIQVQGQMIAVLLQHLEPSSNNRNTVSFRLNSKSIELGPDDFALITGLKYGKLPEIDLVSSDFHKNVFQGRRSIKFHDIHSKFVGECRRDGNSPEALKLGLLYLVYGFLLCGETFTDNVDLRYVHLVDDLELFLNFPWGTISYNFIVSHMHRAAAIAASRESARIKMYGFMQAFQVWVYEVFPNVGREFANILEFRSDRFPRILRWTTAQCPSTETIQPHFTVDGGLEMVLLRMSKQERGDVQKLRIKTPRKTPKTAPAGKKRARVCKKLSYNEGASVDFVLRKIGDICKEVGAAPKRLPIETAVKGSRVKRSAHPVKGSKHEATPCTGKKRRTVISPAVSYSRQNQEVHADDEGADSNAAILKLSQLMNAVEDVKSICDSNSKKLDELHKLLCGDGSKSPKSHSLPKAPALGFATNFIWDDPHALLTIDREGSFQQRPTIKHSRYDPSELGQSMSDFDPFVDWFLHDWRSDRIVLPNITVTKKWFDDLWFPDRRLSNEHIDALTTLLKIKERMMPEKFLSNWTVLEQLCWGYLACSNFEMVVGLVMPYVQGVLPLIGGMAWHQVDKVYGVGHVLGSHWVLYEVLFREQRIVIYDSLSDCGASAQIIGQFYPIARNLPILCRAGEVWRQKGWNSADLNPMWDILYYPNPPQQLNEYDCGVMCMKFMECLVSDNPLAIIDPARTGVYRKILCGHLFRHRLADNPSPR